MNVITLPAITPEKTPNDARMELVFELAQERPPAAAKRLIMRLRSPEIGFLDDQQAEIALDALNLKLA
jgi:hypothetical protein